MLLTGAWLSQQLLVSAEPSSPRPHDSDRVLDEQQIPHAGLSCGLCENPILEGTIHTFHGSCDAEQFEKRIDIRPLKDEALRILRPGNAGRELLLALSDRVSRAEALVLFPAVLTVLQNV